MSEQYNQDMNETTHQVNPAPESMKRVRFITNSEAKPEMTLALMIEEVRNNQLFKLSAGVVLTEEMIEQIRRHQINCFAIVINETRSIEEISMKLIESQKQVKSVFSLLNMSDSVANDLYSSLMEYRLCFS